MEFKTTLEELISQTGAGHGGDTRLDTAYRLLSNGSWSAAEAIFDEILNSDPQNERALTGKRMISRERSIEERIARYNERLDRARPEAAPPKEPRFRLLRSKKTQMALVAAFVLFCSAFGTLLLTSSDEPQTDAGETASFSELYDRQDRKVN